MDGITKGGNLLPEPSLSACALLARSQILIDISSRKESNPGDTVSEKAWLAVSGAACDYVTTRRLLGKDENPFEILSTYLRALADYGTLMGMNQLEPFKIRKKAMSAVVRRLSSPQTVDLEQIPPYLGFWVEQFQDTATWSYGDTGNAIGRRFMVSD